MILIIGSKTGANRHPLTNRFDWIPAYAGMTVKYISRLLKIISLIMRPVLIILVSSGFSVVNTRTHRDNIFFSVLFVVQNQCPMMLTRLKKHAGY